MEQREYPFKITILSAVYKAEAFLDEAIQSILDQTIGFSENVQYILVDDGSPDRSGEICDRYREQYPDNIVVVHQENGGVARARNAGIPYIKGRYVCCMDPDDVLTPDTLETVYDFFVENDHKMDIVAFPMYYFGDRQGPHLANNKFASGTRIINLEKEYQFAQMSLASAFIKHDAAKKLYFNPALATAEDAEQIAKILIENPHLGVVAECRYMYRRYGTSLVSTAPNKKEWYSDYLRHFSMEIMDAAERKFGYVPFFIQNTVMSDLQWKLRVEEAPEVLDAEEQAEYRALLRQCLDRIDPQIIMAQKFLPFDTKMAILASKKDKAPFIKQTHSDVYYGVDYHNYHAFSQNATEFSFLEIREGAICLSLRQYVLNLGYDPTEIYLTLGKEKIQAASTEVADAQKCMGEAVSKVYMCAFEIPTDALREDVCALTVWMRVGESVIEAQNIRMGTYFPLTKKFKNSYFSNGTWIFTYHKNTLLIRPSDPKTVKKMEADLQKEICQKRQPWAIKAVLARKFLRIYKKLFKKEVWIITDRINKAGDNGEAFFRHLKKIGFRGAKYYYAVNNPTDLRKLSHLGSVIKHGTWKYKMLFLACDKVISAHADDMVLNPFDTYSAPYHDILRSKTFVFLQHGVIHNDLSGWLNRYNKDIKGFVTTTKAEHDSIAYGNYFYSPEKVWLTGLPRFDRLYRDERKYITLIPTWRRYLMDHLDQKTGVWMPAEHFKESRYFRFYNALLNDERLVAAAQEYGYRLCFMPHPNIITIIDAFDRNEVVKFFSIDTEYRDMYAQSDLILTDYSSAAFDFAYLRKPIVYSQFDFEEFYGGNHVCQLGYFDYERDGFGEITKDIDSTVELLIDYMKNGCQLKDEYRERIDRFFAFNDQNNCQRILDKILEMDRK